MVRACSFPPPTLGHASYNPLPFKNVIGIEPSVFIHINDLNQCFIPHFYEGPGKRDFGS